MIRWPGMTTAWRGHSAICAASEFAHDIIRRFPAPPPPATHAAQKARGANALAAAAGELRLRAQTVQYGASAAMKILTCWRTMRTGAGRAAARRHGHPAQTTFAHRAAYRAGRCGASSVSARYTRGGLAGGGRSPRWCRTRSNWCCSKRQTPRRYLVAAYRGPCRIERLAGKIRMRRNNRGQTVKKVIVVPGDG